jgi:hypothetical protein
MLSALLINLCTCPLKGRFHLGTACSSFSLTTHYRVILKEERRLYTYILIRDGFRCKKCRVIPIYPTTDHILPKIFGGTSKDDNLMCHREKDELGGMYKMTEESMVCGLSVFEKKVLKRFRINPSRR